MKEGKITQRDKTTYTYSEKKENTIHPSSDLVLSFQFKSDSVFIFPVIYLSVKYYKILTVVLKTNSKDTHIQYIRIHTLIIVILSLLDITYNE